MRKYLRIAAIVLMALSLVSFVGCDPTTGDGGGSSEDPTVGIPHIVERGPTAIRYINFDRTQFVLADGWTMNITGETEVNRQRPSCSGYSHDSVYSFEMSDRIWYKYDQRAASTHVEQREADAVVFEGQRAECTEAPIQYVVDIDADRDGVGATQDADDNDPNVQ